MGIYYQNQFILEFLDNIYDELSSHGKFTAIHLCDITTTSQSVNVSICVVSKTRSKDKCHLKISLKKGKK